MAFLRPAKRRVSLSLLAVSLTLGAGPRESVSPNGALTAFITDYGGPGQAKESTLKIQTADGRIVLKRGFTSPDGEHGFYIEHGDWTADSRYFVFSMFSSGGHQPWHFPTMVYGVRENRLVDLDRVVGPVTGVCRLLPNDSLEVVTRLGSAPEITKIAALRDLFQSQE